MNERFLEFYGFYVLLFLVFTVSAVLPFCEESGDGLYSVFVLMYFCQNLVEQ